METKKTRITYLISGTVCLLFIGIIYAWSILRAPLCDAYGWNSAQAGLNYTITIWMFVAGICACGWLTGKINRRALIAIGSALTGAAYILSPVLLNTHALSLYVFYGALSGFGTGLAYNAVISTVTGWFPDKKGLCSGILMLGFGSSTLLLGNAVSKMLASGVTWQRSFLLAGLAIVLVGAVSAAILREPEMKAAAAGASDDSDGDVPTKMMVKTGAFWYFFLFALFLATVGSVAITFGKDIFIFSGAKETFAVSMVGYISICNGLGRLLCGALSDGVGLRRTLVIASLLALVSPVLMLLSIYEKSLLLASVGGLIAGLSYGFAPTLTAVFIRQKFGGKYFSKNYSLGNTSLLPASLSSTAAGALLQSSGSFLAPFYMLIALALLGVLFAVMSGRTVK